VGAIPWRLAGRRVHPPLGGTSVTRLVGAVLIAAGVPLVGGAFVRFARAAGTPAPVFETEGLVIEGPYRWVRNPQYVGVVVTVAGEGLLYGSRRVLAWACALWTAFHLFVRLYEEPRLRRRFGSEYDAFIAEVPRWIPRAPSDGSA
jgi:protein-S-isoprenylcysteine O-methyltransferase Ste14